MRKECETKLDCDGRCLSKNLLCDWYTRCFNANDEKFCRIDKDGNRVFDPQLVPADPDVAKPPTTDESPQEHPMVYYEMGTHEDSQTSAVSIASATLAYLYADFAPRPAVPTTSGAKWCISASPRRRLATCIRTVWMARTRLAANV